MMIPPISFLAMSVFFTETVIFMSKTRLYFLESILNQKGPNLFSTFIYLLFKLVIVFS